MQEAISERQAASTAAEPLYIKGRNDLVTALEKLEYQIKNRTGKLWLPEYCTVNGPGAIRLFKDIDPGVKRIEVFSGTKLDGIYRVGKRGGWVTEGFPFP